jgi:hypothetical protein
MSRFLLVFLAIFCQFQVNLANFTTCWEVTQQIQEIFSKNHAIYQKFTIDNVHEINHIFHNPNLSNQEKTAMITSILVQKRTEILRLKWAGIRELEGIFSGVRGKIIDNGLKKFLGLNVSPTLFPFRCIVKEAKMLAISAYDAYKWFAQRGVFVKKVLNPNLQK